MNTDRRIGAPRFSTLAEALAHIATLEARIEELSAQLKLRPTAQREWLYAQTPGETDPHLESLAAAVAGRRVKLSADRLVEAWRAHHDRGVNCSQIAKSLRCSHTIISRFLNRDYTTEAAEEAYRRLDVKPRYRSS